MTLNNATREHRAYSCYVYGLWARLRVRVRVGTFNFQLSDPNETRTRGAD
jgi:hypothetical protein